MLASNNPFALIVLTAKRAKAGEMIKKEKRDSFFMDLKINLAKELLSRNIPKEKTRILMDFLKYYVRFIDPNNNIIFEKQLETLTGKNITMGIEELLLDMAKKEGREEGREEAREESETKLKTIAINLKNQGYPVSNIVSALGLSTQQVEALNGNI